MDLSRLGVRLLEGVGLLVIAFVALCGLLFLRGPWCWACRGTGGSIEPDFRWTCRECRGGGLGNQLHLRLYRIGGAPWRLALVRNRVDLWEGDPEVLPVLCWFGAGVFTLIGLIVGLRGGACPLCDARGMLLLEVEPPGRPPKNREVCCPACEGKGALTRLDRWLAGV